MDKKEIDKKEIVKKDMVKKDIDTYSILKEIEKKGAEELKMLSNNLCEKSLLEIMKKGEEEFIEKTGRHMTYSEMRAAYG